MNPDYNLIDAEEEHQRPVANIFLRKDGHGNVDIVINSETVAFFNSKGELWLVNFDSDAIEDLERAGIRFEPSKEDNREEYFTVKVV